MSSIDCQAISGPTRTAVATGLATRWIGRVLISGIFLALSVAVVPVAMVYSFIWIAKI